jgi:hypothetical protein
MMVMIGPMHEQARGGFGRHHDFLEQQLERVGDRLQQAQRADAVRADADLDPADQLALPQRGVGHQAHQRQQHADDLEQRPGEGQTSEPTRAGAQA